MDKEERLECVCVFSAAMIIWVDKFLIKCKFLFEVKTLTQKQTKTEAHKVIKFKAICCVSAFLLRAPRLSREQISTEIPNGIRKKGDETGEEQEALETRIIKTANSCREKRK